MGRTTTSFQRPRIRCLYDTDHKDFSNQNKTTFVKPTMALAHFEEMCNIKSILQKYEERGSSPLEVMEGFEYTTYDKNYSYQDLRDHMIKVKEDFMQLPSSVRAQFKHNPGNFYVFMQNPANIKIGVEQGFLVDNTPPELGATLEERIANLEILSNLDKTSEKE